MSPSITGELLRSAHAPAEADDRIGNIEELIGSFEDFEEREEDASLAALLERYALVQDTDSLEEKPETVSLMTVHSAKGLEFPVELIVGLEDGIFPHARSLREGPLARHLPQRAHVPEYDIKILVKKKPACRIWGRLAQREYLQSNPAEFATPAELRLLISVFEFGAPFKLQIVGEL